MVSSRGSANTRTDETSLLTILSTTPPVAQDTNLESRRSVLNKPSRTMHTHRFPGPAGLKFARNSAASLTGISPKLLCKVNVGRIRPERGWGQSTKFFRHRIDFGQIWPKVEDTEPYIWANLVEPTHTHGRTRARLGRNWPTFVDSGPSLPEIGPKLIGVDADWPIGIELARIRPTSPPDSDQLWPKFGRVWPASTTKWGPTSAELDGCRAGRGQTWAMSVASCPSSAESGLHRETATLVPERVSGNVAQGCTTCAEGNSISGRFACMRNRAVNRVSRLCCPQPGIDTQALDLDKTRPCRHGAARRTWLPYSRACSARFPEVPFPNTEHLPNRS